MAYTNVPKSYLDPADDFPAIAGAGGVTGKTFVTATTGSVGNRPTVVTVASSGGRASGLAGRDAVAGDSVPLITEGVWEVACGSVAITAGTYIQSDASGKAIALASGVCLGQAFAAISANGSGPINLTGM